MMSNALFCKRFAVPEAGVGLFVGEVDVEALETVSEVP